ncbi:hypothetical protein [Cupriavidus necator]
MATVTGQVTFVIKKQKTTVEERLTVMASECDIECNVTDSEDDKLRESVYIKYYGSAFEGNASFTALFYYDVFGSTIFDYNAGIDEVTKGYTVTLATDEPDDGLTVEAFVDLNERD